MITFSKNSNLLMQAKAGILLAQPTFILVLTFMVRLRRELAERDREHHQGKERLLAMQQFGQDFVGYNLPAAMLARAANAASSAAEPGGGVITP